MDKFENVTVVKKANVFYNGNVTSRTVLFADGSRKTLGIILPGIYEFDTAVKERMEVLNGTLKAQLPGSTEWKVYEAGQAFEVPAKCKFTVAADGICDYCCSFINE